MASKHELSAFLGILPAVLYEYVLYPDSRSELLYLSPSSKEILGRPPEYFVEDVNRFWEMVHPNDLQQILTEDVRANKTRELFVSEVRFFHPNGQEHWLQLSSKPTPEQYNGVDIWIGYIIDITRLKDMEGKLLQANRKLQALSDTDGLTGLANRRRFDEALANEWARYQRSRQPFALILVDIDYFKSYNDHYGHQSGDDCLKAVANVLKETARRHGDISARYGGEELINIAIDTRLVDAQVMAEHIRQTVEALDIRNEYVPCGRVTVSVGVSAIFDQEYPDSAQLFKAADTAMYQAKSDQRNCVRVAEPG
ncbi:sensor domain-containing diguanylate cyclase [Marinobacterium sp. MBR-109]|jgi:diguanylate cyclase (GGDEF)-like protein/PAS domain S-box-containing protein|uniref:sensor domain-containing diguanylate cyclase n=1 Tax=Marinobacterium sp. MBR-109 TaxID=3156462 RepID=UPI00339A4BD0